MKLDAQHAQHRRSQPEPMNMESKKQKSSKAARSVCFRNLSRSLVNLDLSTISFHGRKKNWFWMLHQLINLHWWHCLVFQPFHKHFAKARIFFLLPSLEHVSCKNNIQPVEISFVNAPFCCCNGRIKPCGTLTMNGLASKVFACLGCKYREMLWQNWIGLLQEFQKCQFYIYTREGGCDAAMLKVFPGLHSADILWPPCWIPFVASSFCLAFANRHCVLAKPRSCNFVNLLEPFSTCLKLYWPS